MDFVLGFESIDEMRNALAERRVEALSYRGYTDLSTHLKQTMGLSLAGPNDAEQLDRVISQRNLITHNRSIVNRRYVAKFGTADGEIGDLLRISMHAVVDATEKLTDAVLAVDRTAEEKWGLPRAVSGDWVRVRA